MSFIQELHQREVKQCAARIPRHNDNLCEAHQRIFGAYPNG